METARRWKPRRYLAPELAEAIRRAKEESGLTWRELGTATGASHSHLVNLSKGRRVPSRLVVEALAAVLDLEPATLSHVRDAAS